MHHFGEDAVKVMLTDSAFVIVVKSHHTGVPIVITGPLSGVMQNKGELIDHQTAEKFGHEIAHLARDLLT